MESITPIDILQKYTNFLVTLSSKYFQSNHLSVTISISIPVTISSNHLQDALLNLISQQIDIDQIYLYEKDLSESKYEFLIEMQEYAEIKHLNDPKEFIECPNTMDIVYEDIDKYNPTRKGKVLNIFDDMIADMTSNKKVQAVVKKFL